MTEKAGLTESLCPYCLRRIPASKVYEEDAVYLQKACPEHGDLGKILLWKNNPKTYVDWNRLLGSTREKNLKHPTVAANGCPYACGLCPNHQQDTCTAILEVTLRCDLNCPICFSASVRTSAYDPEPDEIAQVLRALRDTAGSCPLQLSGGEPTLRKDLPQIVALAAKIGFDHLQINTNGLRLGRDADYAKELKDAGVSVFFLQFDGVTDQVYQRIRGSRLLDLKLKAIERCAALKVGVILVPTLVKGINDSQIGSIIEFAKKWIPTVKGVHFQPMTYLGRYPKPPGNEDRITIPDVLNAIEEQTQGELRAENLVPAG